MYKHDRAILAAERMIETKETVREIAKALGVSKSSIHKDLTDRLRESRSAMYPEVTAILEEHRRERHVRGGAATKAKYACSGKGVQP